MFDEGSVVGEYEEAWLVVGAADGLHSGKPFDYSVRFTKGVPTGPGPTPRACGCGTSPGGLGWTVLLLPLLMLRRQPSWSHRATSVA